MSGIYSIRNKSNNKVYIGSSFDINKRWMKHINDLKNGTHHSVKLQRAYDITKNIDDFEFSVLEDVDDIDELKEREQYYIDLYDAYRFGYNCCSSSVNLKFKEDAMFVSLSYTPNEALFKNLNDPAIAKLIFLSTYLNGNGFLADSKGKPIHKEDLPELLGINSRGVRRFIYESKKNMYIYEKDKLIYFNQNIFFRGISNGNCTNYMKLYLTAIRSLYRASPKTLAFSARMIPYVNIEYNILCFNPTEKNIKNIRGLKLIDLAKALNVSIHNVTRFRNQIIDKSILINGCKENVCNLLHCKKLSHSAKVFFINPCVYYAGTHWNEVEILGCF